jgi:dynein heavy chain
MEPFEPIPGKPPRKVVIDRQRKLFASLDIQELLLEFDIDYSEPEDKKVSWLQLEAFDDTEYDSRMPEEWIEYGRQEDGQFFPIPGKGLRKDKNGTGTWQHVLIYEYDEEKEKFVGNWDDEGQERVELTRINLLFNAEDPRIFA